MTSTARGEEEVMNEQTTGERLVETVLRIRKEALEIMQELGKRRITWVITSGLLEAVQAVDTSMKGIAAMTHRGGKRKTDIINSLYETLIERVNVMSKLAKQGKAKLAEDAENHSQTFVSKPPKES